MNFALYKKIVDECAANDVYSIRLSWRGEVLVNRDFPEYVRYAKQVQRIPNVSFLTNGSLLKGELARKLIEYGVDYISVSIDGLAPVYEKIRAPVRFATIIENLREFKELRMQMGRSKPVVRVTTLWPAIANDPQAFYDTLSPVCDKIVYNPLKDYSVEKPIKEHFICQFPWERLFIGFDGSVQPCSNTKETFSLANAHEMSIRDIWHSAPMQQLRRIHRSGRRMEITPCNTCSYGIDYDRLWRGRDWTKWDPCELDPNNNKSEAQNAS
jgi:radical SAM protein with 4Fe4S-binding SPASM domain